MGGTSQEEDTYDPKVPTCRCRSFPDRDFGQEEPETRGPQGTARSGHQVSYFSCTVTDLLFKLNLNHLVTVSTVDSCHNNTTVIDMYLMTLFFANLRAAREKTKAAKAQKKAAAAPSKPNKAVTKSKAARPQKAAPRVGGKR